MGINGAPWKATSFGPGDVQVVVTPASFFIANGASQSLTIAFTGLKDAQGNFTPGWAFGRIELSRTDPTHARAYLPRLSERD